MPTDRPDPRALAQDALVHLDAARDALTGLSAVLEGSVQTPVESTSWRTARRPGTPSRIEADQGLRAVILARIDRLTFDAVVSELAAHVPPERRVSRSALHRW